jgi:hypothetical protein
MRQPIPSFRNKLAAVPQDNLLALPTIDGITLHYDRKRDLVAKIISTWMDRSDAEAIWSTVSAKLPEVTEVEFVHEVVRRRLMLEKIADITEKALDLEAKVKHRTKRYQKQRNYAQLVFENAALAEFTQRYEREVGRQGSSAARSYFMWQWAATFEQACGQPLYEVVSALTEIAFGGNASVDAVRKAAVRHRTTRPPK